MRHHPRIGVHHGKRRAIIGPPATEQKTLGPKFVRQIRRMRHDSLWSRKFHH
jgi:hypothetical protein